VSREVAQRPVLDVAEHLVGAAGRHLAAALAQYEGYVTAQQSIHQARAGEDEASDRRALELESVLRRASDVERQLVLEARRRGEVSAGSADEVLRDIENRALRDFA